MLLFLLACGLLAGLLAGGFGIGGGVLFSPLLLVVFTVAEVPDAVSWTIGTSLFCTFVASLGSVYQQWRFRNCFWRESIWIGGFGTAGMYAGKQMVTSGHYTALHFVLLFGLLVLGAGLLRYRQQGSRRPAAVPATRRLGALHASAAGTVAGLIAALTGLGGGIIIVPMLNLIYRQSLVKAVSISSFCIVLISLAGWLQFAFLANMPINTGALKIGFVDLGAAFPIIAGAFIGGLLGVRLGWRLLKGR